MIFLRECHKTIIVFGFIGGNNPFGNQDEASSSRIITAFTTMSARMNIETIEKLPSTSLEAGAAATPGGGARSPVWAAGPVGARTVELYRSLLNEGAGSGRTPLDSP